MQRKTFLTPFLTIAALIALGVGAVALLQPAALLASKGVALNPAAEVWMRELGCALVATGVVAWLVRAHPASPTLQAVLVGNAVLQLGLLPIEILAYRSGVITQLSGIVPNSVLHLALAAGFAWFAWPATPRPRARAITPGV